MKSHGGTQRLWVPPALFRGFGPFSTNPDLWHIQAC